MYIDPGYQNRVGDRWPTITQYQFLQNLFHTCSDNFLYYSSRRNHRESGHWPLKKMWNTLWRPIDTGDQHSTDHYNEGNAAMNLSRRLILCARNPMPVVNAGTLSDTSNVPKGGLNLVFANNLLITQSETG